MKILDKILYSLDPIEQKQLSSGKNIIDINTNDISAMKQISHKLPRMPRTFFRTGEDIIVRKHHRFSTMVTHVHDFIELNYIYSGNCTETINDQKITLHKHTLLMLDKNTPHSIGYMGKKDILINILLKDGDSLNSILDNISKSSNIVTQFMYNASKINSIHDNYIIFDFKNNDYARNLIDCLIYQGISTNINKNQSMKALYSLLIPEFNNSIETEAINFKKEENTEILQILNYLDHNYKTISLSKMAKDLGYNTNYLSNKIKNETGKNFQQLIDQKKFYTALAYLKETNLSIDKIAFELGYSSTPSFFRLFQRMHASKPSTYRKNKGRKK